MTKRFVWAFFLILITLILINSIGNGSFKIETSWIAIALAPVIIWLLTSGQLSEFSGFGLGFKLREAAARPVSLSLEGSRIEPVPVKIGEKGEVREIPDFVKQRVGAMSLELGRRDFYGDSAIRDYLDRLTQHDFFRYVVFTDSDGRFRGVVSARALLGQLRDENVELVHIIEEGVIDRLNGIVTSSVRSNSNKREILKKMDAENRAELPVVNEDRRFVGIIDRDKLTSSILLELVARL